MTKTKDPPGLASDVITKKKKDQPVIHISEKSKRKAKNDGNPRHLKLKRIEDLEKEIADKYDSRKASHYAPHQRNLLQSQKFVSKIVGLPDSKDDMEHLRKQIELTPTSKNLSYSRRKTIALQKQLEWKAFQKHKPLEAELHLWDSVTALRYKLLPDANKESGSFSVVVKSTGEEVPVPTDWVQSNFEKDVVTAVMQSTYSTFLPVATDIKIKLDNRQIQQVRYYVSEKKKGESYFEGITSDGRVTRLAKEFVDDNLPIEFVSLVVNEGKEQKRKHFFHVPPGAPRTMEGHIMIDQKYPKLEFMQWGESTCLFSSFASALHYLHIEDVAVTVHALSRMFSTDVAEGTFNWKALLDVMSQACSWLQPIKIHGSSFDILNDVDEYPTIVCLEAVDGGTQHAVTVVGKLVFDSNCERALPLVLEILDYCCSTDKKEGAFKRVYKGYRFREPPEKKKKKLDQLKKEFNIDFFTDEIGSDLF